ncbi:hypothetical protein H4R99_003438 [Coemansia sp. RSA 1722]|nr:hypothetical protein H4R99_003438 [Coemansia sp. RSA 1722]KAJ2602720.1 hypothetical protein GGF39_000598 [Coemansia sp. RSA 1721]
MKQTTSFACFVLCLSAAALADTYQRSPCNVVHWTRMLEGRIIVEAKDKKPIDIENLFFYERDLPPNHRIIHTYDDEVTDRRPDRLSIYVDRENIFLTGPISSPQSPPLETRKKQRKNNPLPPADMSSPMHISTPDCALARSTTDLPSQAHAEAQASRMLLDTDPIRVSIAVDFANSPEDIRAGLAQIVNSHNVGYFYRPGSSAAVPGALWSVRFEHVDVSDQSLSSSYEIKSSVKEQGISVVVRYRRTVDAFRALGQVLTAAREAEVAGTEASAELGAAESAQFETLALMIDCSRNGVMSVASICAMLRNMALMGYNMLQLYTEDTYKVPGEPFFGYLRGGYTQEELRAVDDYAFNMGIEVVACIQTLGHLGQILQWPRYAALRDTNEVILSRLPETYELLEKLIRTVSAPLRSRRIHIGMDEAYGVGEGRFRALFGAQEGTAIFVEHLARVHAICGRLGLRPMIWSDMLFCLAAKNNALYAYYDQSNNPAEAFNKVEGIPPDIDLIFWDYYHTQPEIYARKIQQHKELGCDSPWVAGGAWTWSRLWCYLPFSFESNRASLVAAKSPAGRVSSFMLTIWGDEGNECDFFSALPVMLYAGNHGYTDKLEIDATFMENSFAAICGGSLGDWMQASRLDEIPQEGMMDMRATLPSNMSKWILWEDPMLSFMSPQYAALDLELHFTQIADRMLDCALSSSNTGRAAFPGSSAVRYPLNRLLRLPGLLARVLSLKSHLRDKLVVPYRAGDRAALLQVAETRLRPLIEAQRELWLYHRSRWHRIYKPFGWETLELRYGGLTARLQTMYDRIVAYCLQQPGSVLRRSRAIGVTAGVSRHPALLPPIAGGSRSRNPSKFGEGGILGSAPVDGSLQDDDSSLPLMQTAISSMASVPMVPGPSMIADESSGLSVGAAPAWLPVATSDNAPIAAAESIGADEHKGLPAGSPTSTDALSAPPVATVSLGWPVTAAVTTAGMSTEGGPVLQTSPSLVATIPLAAGPVDAQNQNQQQQQSSDLIMTSFPQPSAAVSPSDAAAGVVTTINALGVRELGGEGDFWLQPAPMLPPELDPIAGIPSGIGCLGEESDDIVDCLPELEEDLQCIYENAYTSLILDYGRVSAPSRLG